MADGYEVDMQMCREQLRELFNFKILLLGAGESGKSTVVKQLKLIHKQKLGPAELRSVGNSLHMNVIDCLRSLVQACKRFGFPLGQEHANVEQYIEEFKEGNRIPANMCVALTVLFNAPSMRQTYTRRNEFWLLDSFGYYMENLPRFCDPNFTPTEEDVVMARIRTTGIVATPLEQKIAKELPEEPDSLRFNVIDVGGQRNERKKWLHCFDDVKCVLFLVNLAGFNQVLFEDNSKNRMHESLELFKTIVNKDLFRKIPIFLFLNKKDLFEQQILQTDMKQTFPSYQGGKNNSNALQYITEMFQAEMPKKKALVQVVTGTWKRDIKCAFEAVKSTLYDMNRRKLLQKASDIRARMAELERAHAKANAGCCGPAPAKQPINKK